MFRLILVLLILTTAAFAQAHSVTLTWAWSQGTGDPATGFHVKRSSVSGGPYTIIGVVPVATVTYQDTVVTAGLTYFYVVAAYNGVGESANTVEIRAVIPFAVPLPPTSLSATVQ